MLYSLGLKVFVWELVLRIFNLLKISKVVAMTIIQGDDSTFTYYRPISLLWSVSKIVEKVFIIKTNHS